MLKNILVELRLENTLYRECSVGYGFYLIFFINIFVSIQYKNCFNFIEKQFLDFVFIC